MIRADGSSLLSPWAHLEAHEEHSYILMTGRSFLTRNSDEAVVNAAVLGSVHMRLCYAQEAQEAPSRQKH